MYEYVWSGILFIGVANIGWLLQMLRDAEMAAKSARKEKENITKKKEEEEETSSLSDQ